MANPVGKDPLSKVHGSESARGGQIAAPSAIPTRRAPREEAPTSTRTEAGLANDTCSSYISGNGPDPPVAGGIVWIGLALAAEVVTSQGQHLTLSDDDARAAGLLAVIAPFALLIATVHALNRLNGDSELIVMTASGATSGSSGGRSRARLIVSVAAF